MILLEKEKVIGFEEAIRGMRNPMNSWDKSDSKLCNVGDCAFCEESHDDGLCSYREQFGGREYKYILGQNDEQLAMKLAKAGPVHGKFRRMIVVYVDITAPLYWWKEFDTYKVGTVANSCSTMHKIHAKEFTLEDFSHEHLLPNYTPDSYDYEDSVFVLKTVIKSLNYWRERFLETKDKEAWWQMIQLLPTSYNQKRTVMLNYEVLSNIYEWRRDHKQDEWRKLCEWIKTLPYSEIITCNVED